MYSQINVKSKIKDYSVNFVSLSEIHKLIGEDYHLAVVDKNVANYFPKFNLGDVIVLDTDEDLKSWRGLEKIFDEFAAKKVNTQTKLIVIGGGVLQDAVGFCASVYCRGIEYYLVPTTLLSQIDSCVGGKTSINYGSRKNILGTFYPPKEILICEDWIYGLNKENFCSGLGELFKFDILRNKIQESKVNELISGNENVLHHIYESLKYKISILEIDEFDKKERKYLNFGHTFGHALEITSNYKLSHGYAVVIGCLIALKISVDLFDFNKEDFALALNLAKNILKNTINIEENWFDYDSLMECVKSDKKNTGCLNMVLLKDNNPVIQKIDDYSIIKEALVNVYEALRLCN
jgi:3-dehydroquinate synthase